MQRILFIAILTVVLCLQFAKNESVKISPKLDFVESKEDGRGKGTSPKIQGVRVVVDTTNTKKSTESKSIEDDTNGENADKDGKRKTVGIHTDITVEITDSDDDNTSNQTTKTTDKKNKNKDDTVIDDDDDDDSDDESDSNAGGRRVPVIKGSGTGGGATKPPTSDEGWNIHSVPVVYGTDDHRSDGASHKPDRWDGRLPLSPPLPPVWTTERPPHPPLRPSYYYVVDYYPKGTGAGDSPSFKASVPYQPQPWKPMTATTTTACRCPGSAAAPPPPNPSLWKTYYRADRRTFVRPIESRPPPQLPTDSSSRGVDDKLEYPFISSAQSDY